MDLLKRNLAPDPPRSLVRDRLRSPTRSHPQFGGTKLVDFSGPHGWQHAAVNLGKLQIFKKGPAPGVHAGLRGVQPLVELRSPIMLEQMLLDTVPRGAKGIDLAPVVEAAEKIAHAEDDAIFNGYKEAGITGIIEASPHRPVPMPADPTKYPQAIVEARQILHEAGINGPYALALGTQSYNAVAQAAEDGYPIRKRIDRQIIDGPIVRAPSIQGGVLISMRGGDFELTVGQDLSIGYVWHDREKVELYLTESFTFRILDPAAAISLRRAGK